MITKSQFVDWKNSAVTLEMEKAVLEVVSDVGGSLINKVTSDPNHDAYLRGFIRGVQAGREWEPEFAEDADGQS